MFRLLCAVGFAGGGGTLALNDGAGGYACAVIIQSIFDVFTFSFGHGVEEVRLFRP